VRWAGRIPDELVTDKWQRFTARFNRRTGALGDAVLGRLAHVQITVSLDYDRYLDVMSSAAHSTDRDPIEVPPPAVPEDLADGQSNQLTSSSDVASPMREPNPPAKAPDIEKVRDRRYSVLTTIIAGLLGGVLGAAVSLVGTREQIGSQRSEAQRQFLQEQRRTAYATFVTDESELDRDEIGLGIITDPRLGRPSTLKLRTLRSPLDSSYQKTLQDVGGIDIIGSDNAGSIADKIRDIHSKRYYWVIVGDAYITNSLGTDAQYQAVSPGILGSAAELTSLEREFIEAARRDLGSS
jgi:hypothetical protein